MTDDHTVYDSRTADKFVTRFPEGMRERVAARAKLDERSMNSTVIQCVGAVPGQPRRTPDPHECPYVA